LKSNTVVEASDPSLSTLTAKTPASFKLARKGEYKITISKDGYKNAEVLVKNKITNAGSAGMAGNVLVGGIIGVGVDTSTGAMKDLTQL